MAAMSQNGRQSEKEFQTNKPQFLNIMIGDFWNQLRIPREFMSNFRENLSETIRLRGPSGCIWTVELKRVFDHVVFLKGWEEFVKDHSLERLDLLVFHYEGHSTFNVLIFDWSGREREEAYFVRQNGACSSNARRVSQQEDVENLDKLKKSRGNPSSKAVPNREKHPPEGKSAAATEGIHEVSMDESEEEDSVSSMEASEDWSDESVSLKKRKSKTKQGKMKRRSYHMYYLSNRRVITEEEKQRPCELARLHSSTRPYGSIVMKPCHVCKDFRVTIPKKWQMSISDSVKRALLKVPPGEKTWPVSIRRFRTSKLMQKGWAKFVLDNNLEEHDVCVFELNEEGNTECIVLNVIICRVLDEIVPLTVFRPSYPRN
ncbi:hypothetical protein COLO4_26871 [Corchorus olitorius]|uniref:TF-B3 domain-containing protein n=1 Tax=Corchorus olitorius TaxID=93759 RepID=A0A1R3HTW7_9ROSI|nr:hypothetical protein COLO4_26871 [Corchorus olitorius]